MNIKKIAEKIAEEIYDMAGRDLDANEDMAPVVDAIVKSAAMVVATVDECLREIRNEIRTAKED